MAEFHIKIAICDLCMSERQDRHAAEAHEVYKSNRSDESSDDRKRKWDEYNKHINEVDPIEETRCVVVGYDYSYNVCLSHVKQFVTALEAS